MTLTRPVRGSGPGLEPRSLPPLYGLGIHYRGMGTFNAQQTIALAAQMREHHMPCDIWGVEPGWQSHSYSCSFLWSHTISEKTPWVSFDLGTAHTLSGLVVVNRADERPEILNRAASLIAETSLDGDAWSEIWRADGAEHEWRTVFSTPRRARYVRLRLSGIDFLHLKRVRIYGSADQ